jgi:hypothetical protein
MRRLEVGSSKLPWGRSSLKETGVSAEWDEYVHDLHQLRLKHVRADVKEHMKTPRSLQIHRRMKEGRKGDGGGGGGGNKRSRKARREAVAEERYMEIERANRALLNRLSDVMRKPGDVSEMVHASMVQHGNTHKTLNEGYRKKQMKRIDAENEKLITRIESGESTYSRKAWASDRRKQEKYLKNLSRYRNGPQATAMRTAPKMKKHGGRRRRRGGGGGASSGGSAMLKSGGPQEFTGFMDWRRQKHHQKKKKWAKSLPPLEGGGNSPMMGHSESAPSMSFGRPEMQMGLGSTLMTETTLGSGDVRSRTLAGGSNHRSNHHHGAGAGAGAGGGGGRDSGGGLSLSGSIGGYDSHNNTLPIKSLSPKKKAKSPKAVVPNHTKVFEAGRQMNDGKFAVLSAITRGPSLIIQAFVPEDQTTTEVEVSPKDAKFALRHLSNDIFRPERREDLCRALVAKVEFFFKDNVRLLLFNKVSLAGNPKSPVAPTTLGMPIHKNESKSKLPSPKRDTKGSSSPGGRNKKNKTSPKKKKTKKSAGDQEKSRVSFDEALEEDTQALAAKAEEEDEEAAIRGALEGVLNLIPTFREGVVRKTDWLAAVSTSDRVKTVLRSEVLCGYPVLRVLREPGSYSNELHKLETSQDGFVDLEELLLFANDLSVRAPAMASGSGGTVESFRAACKLFNRSQRTSGRHVLLTLHDWCHLRIHDIFSPVQGVYEAQLAPMVSDLVRRADTTKDRVGILREYILEEELIPPSNVSTFSM